MRYRENLRELSQEILRVENGAMHVDLVRTSQGLLRIGSMPDISKLMARFDLREQVVIVPDWAVSQAGDNHTGEEFVQWRAKVYGSSRRDYIGPAESIQILYHNLDAIFSYYFDKKRIAIVQKDWLDRWLVKKPVGTSYKVGAIKVLFEKDNIVIIDEGREVYDLRSFSPSVGAQVLIEEVLADVPRDSLVRDDLEITVVGSGNGFCDTTASFLVRFGSRVLWVDPCAQPAHSLAGIGVHWDDVTDVLITHNHEDHILGFSACLKRNMDHKKKLRLITARGIYQVLKKQFSPLFPKINNWIDLMEIDPGKVFDLDGMKILSRWNHHFLPYGTLGIKISAGDRTWGLSGDTKFDTKINRILKRVELEESWFSDCDLVFHEVDFKNPKGVHTYWKEIYKIRDVIPGELFVYHTRKKDKPPIPIALEGMTYHLI
jgi:L-ascorbate metabolism protein UlaG (beta-lactamase superfamily)